jgi:hypothetical protein
MHHVVMFSYGIASWAEGKLTAARYGADATTLLTADTLMEDEDTYAWGAAAAANVGAGHVVVTEGRDPWQVFFDRKYLGNTRVDPCSEVLKRETCRRWMGQHYPGGRGATVHLGIHWSESDRLPAIRANWAPYPVEALLCQPPFLAAREMHDWAEREGLWKQRLYRLGFAHANCGGFCVKGGQAQFRRLLQVMPERYAYHERREQELREYLGKDVSVLRDRRGGKTVPLTLRAFRERVEAGGRCDLFDWGGCGCFTDSAEGPAKPLDPRPGPVA